MKDNSSLSRFFAVRVESVPTDRPLKADIYLYVNDELVKFRKRGDEISGERMRQLQLHGAKNVFIPNEQKNEFGRGLKEITRDPDLKREVRGKFIKESAFQHVEDLFTRQDIQYLLKESEALVSELVDFISADIDAATSLMRLSTHDYYTYNHCVNVAVYTIAISKKIFGEDRDLLIMAGLGGLLHDLGKRKVPTEIINKKGKLDKEEWQEIQRHPEYGVELLDVIPTIPEGTRRIVLEHHENMDGTGYPKGLTDTQISKVARIAAIADVFDALTTKRSYRGAVESEEALRIMVTMQPGKFDNSLFQYFDKRLDKAVDGLEIDKDFDPCDHRSRIKKVS